MWRRKWQPTPVFLPGKSHGQRSLVGCSAWCLKELDMTEWQTLTNKYVYTINIYMHTWTFSCFSHVWLCDPTVCSSPGSFVHGDSACKNWNDLLFPPPTIFPIQGTNLYLMFPASAGGFFTTCATWEELIHIYISFSHL